MSNETEAEFTAIMTRCTKLMHAVQSGVALEHQIEGRSQENMNKHLRVGVNSALIESSALVMALERAGLLSKIEFAKCCEELWEIEVAKYQDRLSKHFGKPVTLR